MAQISSLRAYQQANKDTVTKGNMFSVPPQALVEEPGFNVRDYDDPDVVQHIRNLANAYARGDYVDPVVVKVVDGKLFIREGHCRRLAMLLAIEEGAEILRTPVIEYKGDDAAQVALIVTSNSGLKITTLQTAEVYRRLSAWGFSDTEIAERVGKTSTHVRQMLDLLELPTELKQLIKDGKISATAALETFKEQGTAAVGTINKAVENAEEAGRKRITRKDLGGPKPLPKKVAIRVQSAFSTFTEKLDRASLDAKTEKVTVELTLEEAEALIALKADVGAIEKKRSDKQAEEEQGTLDI
ncbi:ParB/RepB/Spo0J family partition protein [Marinobacterium jannaschii]|uniref:ParB/RepB/Spo0J family partition protein n=1 Tax=Marinobacterium jannaschii TaxID=64970 RepID=UPI000481C0D9|nr:hypothetical protein [Marinobacterium jannaschii]